MLQSDRDACTVCVYTCVCVCMRLFSTQTYSRAVVFPRPPQGNLRGKPVSRRFHPRWTTRCSDINYRSHCLCRFCITFPLQRTNICEKRQPLVIGRGELFGLQVYSAALLFPPQRMKHFIEYLNLWREKVTVGTFYFAPRLIVCVQRRCCVFMCEVTTCASSRK